MLETNKGIPQSDFCLKLYRFVIILIQFEICCNFFHVWTHKKYTITITIVDERVTLKKTSSPIQEKEKLWKLKKKIKITLENVLARLPALN